MCVVVCFFGLVCFVVVFLGGLGFFDEWFCGCCLTNGFVSWHKLEQVTQERYWTVLVSG